MSQHPGHEDPHHDPNAPQHEGGYEAAPSYDAHGGAPAAAVAKPQPVGLAEKLTYAGGVIALIGVVLSLFTPRDAMRDTIQQSLENAGQTATPEAIDQAMQFGLASAVVVGIITAAVWFLLGFFLGKGKNWARIVATVLGVLNVVIFLVSLLGVGMMPGAAAGGGIALILNVISAALAAAIVFLIWKKESTAYFKATR